MSALALVLTIIVVIYAAEGLLWGMPVYYWPAPGWSFTYGAIGLALAILWLIALFHGQS